MLPAQGLVLAPGFVDVHSHADNAPLLEPPDTSKILQGVTTEVVGNCGFALAPRGAHGVLADTLLQRIFPPIGASWGGFADLFDRLDSLGYVTNMVPLAGHHTLRILAIGMSDAAPTAAQQAAMASALDEALDAGVFGLSTGLIYPPGVFSMTDEIIELVRRLPENGIYTTHMRGEGRGLAASVEEAIRIGRETGRRVQISHLKSAGRPNWEAVPGILATLDAARASGVDIRHDVYPYTASSTMMTALLPPWVQSGGSPAVLERLSNPDTRERIRAQIASDTNGDWENMAAGAGWENIVVASTADGRYEGRSVAAVAAEVGMEPFDAAVKIMLDERLRVTMTVHQMSEADLVAALAHPYTMIGSDGLPPGTGGKPHPRTHGTFPRVLARYAREMGVLSLPEAVRRMTSLPADTFGIPQRGRIVVGAIADLVAFDAQQIADQATYEQPTQVPRGIAWVMQAGKVVVRDGVFCGERTGRRLRPAS
ncbi:amidohydrolase family protein [Planosporangium thailandense]|uniref:amidohydrolase family protein n=1 Tax=Planosporangium thailandense TaxID=765197 RepID=UPI00197C39D0